MSNHNLDLEKSVLATLMNVEDSLLQVLGLIAADDFKAERHKEIYRAITHLDSKSEPYDVMIHRHTGGLEKLWQLAKRCLDIHRHTGGLEI